MEQLLIQFDEQFAAAGLHTCASARRDRNKTLLDQSINQSIKCKRNGVVIVTKADFETSNRTYGGMPRGRLCTRHYVYYCRYR